MCVWDGDDSGSYRDDGVNDSDTDQFVNLE